MKFSDERILIAKTNKITSDFAYLFFNSVIRHLNDYDGVFDNEKYYTIGSDKIFKDFLKKLHDFNYILK
jgi:hypothetical protein